MGHGPGSLEDLVKILARSFSPCNIVVVCIWYDLICSLVTMCDHTTLALTELVMCKLWIAKLLKNGLFMCDHPLCMSIH